MTRCKEQAVQKLLVQPVDHGHDNNGGQELTLLQRAKQRKRRIREDNGYGVDKKYMDPHFLVPTSNICERLFSKAGFCLSDRRSKILPSNFESQIFLHVNKEHWSMNDVNILCCNSSSTDD